jgi:hypothetical protein
MPVPAAVAAFAVSKQHVKSAGGVVITQQAVLEIHQKGFAGRVGDPAPFDRVQIKSTRDTGHSNILL